MKFSKWIWGTFLLLAAVFALANQFGGFVELGIGSFIAAFLALAFLVQCVAHLTFAPLPIPLAALYIIFQNPLELPYLQPWMLILAAALASAGLLVLLPKKNWHKRLSDSCGGHHIHHHSRSGDHHPQMRAEDGGNDNNPSVSVNFGAASRYLHADCLETAQLYCSFGALEVFFDQAQLSPNGAEAVCYCSFGAITIYVPRHWQVIDRLSCSLGGVDIDHRFAAPAENAPRLTLTGSVSLSGLEVRFV